MALPLDILPHILGSLDNSDLENCVLVGAAFHSISRQPLFTHLTLCPRTRRTKCAFILGEGGIQPRQYIRKITVTIPETPTSTEDSVFLSSLRLVLQKIGPQLEAFCLQAQHERIWKQLQLVFRDIIPSTMPHLLSLEFLGVSEIPLLATLNHFPLLQKLSLKAESYLIGSRGDDTDPDAFSSLPQVSSIIIDGFVQDDFRGTNSLVRYIKARREIRSLTLAHFCGDEFPLNWYFLEPSTSSLHHLNLGTDLYQTVVSRPLDNDTKEVETLKFSMLPHLQSITFTIPKSASPQEWQLWSSWLARSMENPSDSSPLPLPRQLKLIVQSRFAPTKDSTASLDELAMNSSFEIHMIFFRPTDN
ncbi:hypothetical protein DL96DRAFT_1810836 [Flagelloscypha sp. PMI_526]|nr:hypothetical protein DL96DRAFT_1810836 [Flagelloscypha sp. PMI_526]